MTGSVKHRIAATALAGATALMVAVPAAAAQPTVETWTNHVETSFFDCDGFTVVGVFDISHKLTFYYDAQGVAIKDIERVDWDGTLVNPETGAWLPDGGTRIFFDTLAPDGSYLTTYMVQVRKSRYIHGAGRVDFQTGEETGLDSLQPAHIAAACAALGA